MKNIFTFMLLLVAALSTSCARMRKYDRVVTTSVQRYNIVYKDNKCGLYDNHADSLVLPIKYDALRYSRTATEQGLEFTVWTGEMMDYEGMIAIDGRTNDPMEIMFPKR